MINITLENINCFIYFDLIATLIIRVFLVLYICMCINEQHIYIYIKPSAYFLDSTSCNMLMFLVVEEQ